MAAEDGDSDLDLVGEEASSDEEAKPVVEVEDEEPEPCVEDLQEQLAEIHLFAGCKDFFLESLSDMALERWLEPDESLDFASSGAETSRDTNDLILVRAGAVKVRVADGSTIIAGPGTTFNIVGMLGLIGEAEPFKPRLGQGLNVSLSPRAGKVSRKKNTEALELKDDVKRIENMRSGAYQSAAGSMKPQSLFGERKRAYRGGEGERKQEFGVPEDLNSIYTICPSSLPNLERGKLTGWLPLHCHGAVPGELPTLQAGRLVDFKRGGALLAQISKEHIDKMYDLARDLESPALLDSLNKFDGNCKRLTDIWRIIISRCSRTIFGLPPELTWALAEVAVWSYVDAGESLVEEGDAGERSEDIIVLVEGSARVEKVVPDQKTKTVKKLQIGRLSGGAIIGEFCLMGSQVARAASIIAESMVEIITIPSAQFLEVMNRFPGMVNSFQGRLHEAANALNMRLPDRTNSMQTLKMFQGCDITFLSELANGGERQAFYVGQTLKIEGNDDGTLYILEYGTCGVEVYGEGRINNLPVGRCFGDRTFLGAPRANATVRVSSPIALVLAVGQSVVHSALHRHPADARRFEAVKQLPKGRTLSRLVGHIDVFYDCGSGFVDAICASLQSRAAMPGQTIFVQHAQDSAAMYVLRGGQVSCEDNGKKIKELLPGATFGELSMLGTMRKRNVTVRPITFCFFLEISRESFLTAIEQFPEERDRFQKLAVAGMDESDKKNTLLPKASEKFIFLLNLYTERRFCVIGDTRLADPSMKNSAVLVLTGMLALVDEKGEEVLTIGAGECWNDEALLDIETDETKRLRLKPIQDTEVQIVAKEKWDLTIAEFDEEEQDQLFSMVMLSVAKKIAVRKRGLEFGAPEVLRMSTLFKNISDKTVAALSASMEAEICKPGEMIIESGDEQSRLCILLDGTADLETPNAKVPYGPGKAFGEAELLGLSYAFPFGLRASSICAALFLSQERFRELIAKNPKDYEFFLPLFKFGRKHWNESREERVRKIADEDTDPDYLDMLCKNAEDVFVEPDGTLLAMGDECGFGESSMYMILPSGNAVVEGAMRVVLNQLYPGDIIGEGGALGLCVQRTATVRATGPTVLHALQIRGSALEAIFKIFPDERERLEDLYIQRQGGNVKFAQSRFAWLRDTVVPALGGTPLLAGCPYNLLAAIAAPLSEYTYSRGDIIAESGEESDYMLLVLEGEAEVLTREGDRVGSLEAGSSFGEVSALGVFGIMTATIKATARCRALRVTADAMNRALARPENKVARDAFARLVESRQEQVKLGLPLSALPIGIPPDDLCARILALQAEKVPLQKGEYWRPIPDHDPCGAHIGVFVSGKALFESLPEKGGRPIVTVPEGSLFEEGLLFSRGARLRALTNCEGYRLKFMDFQLALANTNARKKWLHRFQMLANQTREGIIMQLDSVKGCVEGLAPHACDPEIHKWRGRKNRAIVRGQRMRTEKLDLPDLSRALQGAHEVALTGMSSPRPSTSSRMQASSVLSSGSGVVNISTMSRATLLSSMSAPDLRKGKAAPEEARSKASAEITFTSNAVSLPPLA